MRNRTPHARLQVTSEAMRMDGFSYGALSFVNVTVTCRGQTFSPPCVATSVRDSQELALALQVFSQTNNPAKVLHVSIAASSLTINPDHWPAPGIVLPAGSSTTLYGNTLTASGDTTVMDMQGIAHLFTLPDDASTYLEFRNLHFVNLPYSAQRIGAFHDVFSALLHFVNKHR